MRKMILASHGEFAKGILSSVRMVVGRADDIQVFGLMPGEDPGELAEAIERQVKAEPQTQFLILTDILGGSVSNSITRLVCYDNVKLMNGMNLALVIGLYLTDGALSDEEIEAVVTEARNGLGLVKPDFSGEMYDDDEII